MKKGMEFIALALAFGVILWIVDAFLDYACFYHLYNSFWDILVVDMPPRAGYMRAITISAFLIYGLIAAKYATEAEKAIADKKD